MIRHIKLIRNIGTFGSYTAAAAAALDLKRLVLVYAENGRGKTTLAAILRSLASGKSLPVEERKRLGAEHPPHVVLECEGEPSNVMFQNGAWSRTLPNLKIYDDVFVDDNVHSGLNVEASHRQNLHEFTLGEQGVALQRRKQELVTRVSEHRTKLTGKSRAIPTQELRGLSVEEFCKLPDQSDLEGRIKATQLKLRAAEDQDAVKATPKLGTIKLPAFDLEAIELVLTTDLPYLDSAAEARVQAHILTLQDDGEEWIADGVTHMVQEPCEVCPFCGQDITGLELINHYRAYFSEGYTQLKQSVTTMIANVEAAHAGEAQLIFERTVTRVRDTAQFWSKYCDVPSINLDTESITQDWIAARETVTELLQSKQATPLERIELNQNALRALSTYEAQRSKISIVSEMLINTNEAIQQMKEVAKGADINSIKDELAKLEATKARHSNEIGPLCADYLQEKQAKACTETKRKEVTKALEDYRVNVFPALQGLVNSHLSRFNAGFSIDSLLPSNIGGGSGSTCTYNLIFNEIQDFPIAVRSATTTEGEHSFRNSMSAGDRNTLALALFFSSLDQNPNLENTTVVIDDPVSSLDDHRSVTTVQEVGRLATQAGQVIVMSHNKSFLCSIWEEVKSEERVAIELAQNGNTSTIRSWNVTQEAFTRHDQRFSLLREYADTGNNPSLEVAQAIRFHLEGFLRVACPSDFPPGRLLGQFVNACKQRVGQNDEILNENMTQELQFILKYANRFHHDTSPAWDPKVINATELKGFVTRALSFAGPPKV